MQDSGASSVRVELTDEARPDGIAGADIGNPSEQSGNRRGWGVLALVLLVAGGLWWAAKPGVGESSAEANPTSTPTTRPATSTTTITFTDGFERVAFPGFVSGITKVDDGWIAHGSAGSGPSVLHSADGLNWRSVETSLPAQHAADFQFHDGVFSALFVSGDVQSDASWWESSDGLEWSEVARFESPTLRNLQGGVSTSGAVLIGDDTTPAPVPGLNDYLSSALGMEASDPICDIRSTAKTYFFYVCDGTLFLTLAKEDVAPGGAARCLDLLFPLLTNRADVLVRIDRNGDVETFELETLFETVVGVKVTTTGAFLATSDVFNTFGISGSSLDGGSDLRGCYPDETVEEGQARVLHFDAVNNETTEAAPDQGDVGFLQLRSAPDGGTYLLVGGRQVLRTRPGSILFDEAIAAADSSGFVYVMDGTDWLVRTSPLEDGFSFRAVGDPADSWTQVDLFESTPQRLIIEDDFMILIQHVESTPYLVKVPR